MLRIVQQGQGSMNLVTQDRQAQAWIHFKYQRDPLNICEGFNTPSRKTKSFEGSNKQLTSIDPTELSKTITNFKKILLASLPTFYKQSHIHIKNRLGGNG